jgi:hypothetical protein
MVNVLADDPVIDETSTAAAGTSLVHVKERETHMSETGAHMRRTGTK